MLCLSCPFILECSNHGGDEDVEDLRCLEAVFEVDHEVAEREEAKHWRDYASGLGYCGNPGCSICARFDAERDADFDRYDYERRREDLWMNEDESAWEDSLDYSSDYDYDDDCCGDWPDERDYGLPRYVMPRMATSWGDTTAAELKGYSRTFRQTVRTRLLDYLKQG